jgi:hypothetical protein
MVKLLSDNECIKKSYIGGRRVFSQRTLRFAYIALFDGAERALICEIREICEKIKFLQIYFRIFFVASSVHATSALFCSAVSFAFLWINR